MRLEIAPQSDVAGKYVVQRLLASGGMSQVYLARQVSLDREVALKVVFLDPSDCGSVEALRNEAFLAGRVQHPHVVSVVDHGESGGGVLYLAMELLQGASLAETIFRSGPMDAVRVLRILAQVCEALVAVHEAGLVYRDLKPGNIFLVNARGTADFVKLLDFGICTSAPRNPFRLFAGAPGGGMAGTPQYMSPEQILGRGLDARTDLYALGVTAYEMLVARPVFSGPDVFLDHLKTVPLPLAIARPQVRVPRGLDDFLLRLMAKDPEQRPRDASEALERFRQLLPSASLSPGEAPGPRLHAGAEPGWYEPGRARVSLRAPSWVDRPREMALIEAELANLEQSRPALLWLEGEPGAGKSTLGQHVLEVAAHKGLATASCVVQTRMPLLGAWRAAVEVLLGGEVTSREGLQRALPSVGLGMLGAGDPAFEALADLFLPGPGAMDLLRREPVAFAAYAASGIERLLRSVAGRKGLVVHLDDFHLADPSSAEFLDRLVRSLDQRPAPILLLLTLRRQPEGEGSSSRSDFFKARATFRERGGVQRISRLTDRQVDALVNSMCPTRCDSAVYRSVRRAAGGNPLFAVQMCRHLAARGVLVLDAGSVRLAEATDVSVPGALMELLAERVDALRFLADGLLLADLLDRVSLLAARASMSNLSALCETEGRLDLRDALDRLVDRLAAEGYVQRVPWAQDDFVTFAHPLMRDAILQRQPQSALTRLHLFTARVLESAYADDLSGIAQDVGEHYFDAGFLDRAIDYLLIAAERSLEAACLREARDLFTRAETAFQRIGLPADPRLQRVLAALAELDWCQGRYEEAAGRLDAMRGRGLVPTGSPLAIRVDELEARVAEARRDTDGAVRVLQRLTVQAKASGDRHRAATAMLRLANIRMDAGDNAAASALIDEAEVLVRPDGNTRTMGLVHLAAGRMLYKMGASEESCSRLDKALDLLSGSRDFAERAETLFFKGARLVGLGRRADAAEVFQEGIALCESFGFARGLAGHLANLGVCLARLGREEEGQAAIQRSLAIREGMGDRRGVAHALTALADLALARRDFPTARDLSRKALGLCRTAGYVVGERVALVNLAQGCVGLGLAEEAEKHLVSCLGTTRRDQSPSVSLGAAHEALAALMEARCETEGALRQRLNAIQVFERFEQFDRAEAVRALLGGSARRVQARMPQ